MVRETVNPVNRSLVWVGIGLLVFVACGPGVPAPTMLTQENTHAIDEPTPTVDVAATATPTGTDEPAPPSPFPFAMTPVELDSLRFMDNWSPGNTFVTTWSVDDFRWGMENDPHILDITTGQDCLLPLRSEYGLAGSISMDWLPDERLLVWGNKVLITERCGNDAVDITSSLPAGETDAIPRMSPDRNKMLVTSRDGRYIFSIDTRQSIPIEPYTGPDPSNHYWKELTGVAWSPDGSHVSMVTYPLPGQDNMVVWLVDVNTGAAQQLMQWDLSEYGPTGEAITATWIDSRRLFVSEAVQSGPYIFDIESGEATHVPTALFGLPKSQCVPLPCDYAYFGRVKPLSEGAPGYRILLREFGPDTYRYWLYRSETGEAEPLPDVQGGSEEYYFSPDGKWLIYVKHQLPETKIISVRRTDADGGQFVELFRGGDVPDSAENGRGGGMVWFGRDNEYFGISDRQFTVFEMASGNFDSYVLLNLDEPMWASVSPDGSVFLVGGLGDTGQIFRVPDGP